MNLNLGSHIHPRADCINVDIISWTGCEYICDLNQLPWPWKDGSIEIIYAYDIIEHLGKLTKMEIIQELARITISGAKIIIRVPNINHPYALSSLQHIHMFAYNSFEESYIQTYFKLINIKCQLFDGGKFYFELNRWNRWLSKWTPIVALLTFTLERK